MALNCYDGRWDCASQYQNEDNVIQTLDHLYSDPFEGYEKCMLNSTVSSGNRSLDESTEPTDSDQESESIVDPESETRNDEVKIEFKCQGYRCDLPCS